jgi:hypothetical protein
LSRRASRSAPLFGLAPDGVCLARPVTRPAGELLPRRFTLTSGVTQASRRRRSIFCGTVPIRAAHRGTERWALPTIAPCGVRTFLRGMPPTRAAELVSQPCRPNRNAAAIIAPATNSISSYGPVHGQTTHTDRVALWILDSRDGYGLTTATAPSSTSSRPSIIPRIVRVAGMLGLMPTPWCREPSCLSTFIPVQVTLMPPGRVRGFTFPLVPAVGAPTMSASL